MTKTTKAETKTIDPSTEEKIIRAAKKIFTQQGYAATKVRDIADEADINLSLVNYYFRSKEKLFEFVMMQNIELLFEKISPIVNDPQTRLIEKVETIAGHYIDLLIKNPDLAMFIVNEVLSGSNKIASLNVKRQYMVRSHFIRQLTELQTEGKIGFSPMQLVMNLMGMILFPFVSRSMFINVGLIQQEDFNQMMEERKKLLPVWLKGMIKDQ